MGPTATGPIIEECRSNQASNPSATMAKTIWAATSSVTSTIRDAMQRGPETPWTANARALMIYPPSAENGNSSDPASRINRALRNGHGERVERRKSNHQAIPATAKYRYLDDRYRQKPSPTDRECQREYRVKSVVGQQRGRDAPTAGKSSHGYRSDLPTADAVRARVK